MTQLDPKSNLPWRYDFRSNPAAVRDTLDAIEQSCANAQLGDALKTNAQIVLGEVLNNVVEHAYAERDGHPIQVSVLPEPDGLHVYVTDNGAPMPLGRAPDPPMPSLDTGDLPEGGFGWALVRSMTRDMSYRREGVENHLSFTIVADDAP